MNYHLTTVTKAEIANYPKALAKELKKIKKANLPFTVSNWMQEKIAAGDIRLKAGFVPVKDGTYRVDPMAGKGQSPADAVENPPKGTQFVTLLQYLRFIQEYPETLKEVWYSNFCVDEVRYGDWSRCPRVIRGGSGAWLGDGWAGHADGYFGSWVSAGESGNLDFEPLVPTLDVDHLVFGGKIYDLVERK